MTEREERNLARRIADGSSVFDFEMALELVRLSPTDAEKIIRHREERQKREEELDRIHERLHRAAREFR